MNEKENEARITKKIITLYKEKERVNNSKIFNLFAESDLSAKYLEDEENKPTIQFLNKVILQNEQEIHSIISFIERENLYQPFAVFEEENNFNFDENIKNILNKAEDLNETKSENLKNSFEEEENKEANDDIKNDSYYQENNFGEGEAAGNFNFPDQIINLDISLNENEKPFFNNNYENEAEQKKIKQNYVNIDNNILTYLENKKSKNVSFENIVNNISHDPANIFYRILSLAQKEKIDLIQKDILQNDKIFVKLTN